MIEDKDVRVWLLDGDKVHGVVDDCGWLCVLKEVLDVQLSMGAWYGLWWVWLERCRDGSYAVNALRCDVWVVCTCIAVCIVACFIGFYPARVCASGVK